MTALIAAAMVVTATALVLWIGKGDFRRGRLRSIRRIRSTRRRLIGPLRARLWRIAVLAWSRPVRAAVDFQIRQVADRLERASAGAERFVAAEQSMTRALGQLEHLQPPDWLDSWGSPRPRPGQARPRATSNRRGWLPALALGLTAAAAAAGNGWLLYRHLLPAMPEVQVMSATPDSLTISLAFAVLPFLLGLLYFALNAAGRALGLRILGGLILLMILVLAAAEGLAAVIAIEATGLAAPTNWAGIAAITLLAGTAALLPPLVATLAHAATDKADAWMAARERERKGSELALQDRIATRLRDALGDMTSGVQMLNAEIRALVSEPAGRLILHPDHRATVERVSAVLHRVAVAVDRDADGTLVRETSSSAAVARVLGHLFALGVWILAAAGALSIAAAGLRYGAEVGVTGLMTAGAFAAMAALLLGGFVLRLLFLAPGLRFGTAGRTLAVLLLGLATVSLAVVLGPLVAAVEGSLFEGQVLAAGAWLNLMVLVAAVASTHIGEGVAAAAGVVTYTLAAVARAVLTVVDVALAILDRLLTGRRSSSSRRRIASRRGSPVASRTGAAIGDR